MSSPTPTIQDVSAAAWYKISMQNKGAHHYRLLVWQEHTTVLNTTGNFIAYWHIEYQGRSFYQPYVAVTGITAEAALQRFEEELKLFQPATMAEIESRLNQVGNG